MKFENVSEAFNYYRTQSIEAIEKRAAEIDKIIDGDDKADIQSLNIEIEGLSEAKKNIEEAQGLMNNAKEKITKVIGSADAADSNAIEQRADDVLSCAEYRSGFYKTLPVLNRTRASAPHPGTGGNHPWQGFQTCRAWLPPFPRQIQADCSAQRRYLPAPRSV